MYIHTYCNLHVCICIHLSLVCMVINMCIYIYIFLFVSKLVYTYLCSYPYCQCGMGSWCHSPCCCPCWCSSCSGRCFLAVIATTVPAVVLKCCRISRQLHPYPNTRIGVKPDVQPSGTFPKYATEMSVATPSFITWASKGS